MAYMMKAPYFFAGHDLSKEPNAKDFVDLLCKKAGVRDSNEVSAPDWNNSHSMYVIAQLKVAGSKATNVVKAIQKWFWDPKNQMLNFQPEKSTTSD